MKKFLLAMLGVFSISLYLISGVMAKEKVRIGFAMSLTGIYAPGAKGESDAYWLWLEDVNKKGGIFVQELNKRIPVEFVHYDDASFTETTVRIYEKLITNDKVDLLLGPYGAKNSFAVVPIVEKYKVPIIMPTGASTQIRGLGAKYAWFTPAIIGDRQMKALVDLLKANERQIKNAAILYLQELYPRECLGPLESELKKAGIEVILKKDYPVGVMDLSTLLSDVKAKNPDAVLALTYPADSMLLTNQAIEVGLNPKFLFELIGAAAVAFGPKFGANTEGITTVGNWSPKGKWPDAQGFYDRYIAKFKEKPDLLNSVSSYVACQVLEQAVEKAGTLNWEKIKEVISTQKFTTINGPVWFSGSENIGTPSMILQWQKNSLEIVWPQETATVKLLIPKPAWR